VEIIPAKNIAEIVQMFSGNTPLVVQPASSIEDIAKKTPHELVDFNQIVGQQYAKRALLIAAAGGHNILME
jgi:magnesium chelatase family protein